MRKIKIFLAGYINAQNAQNLNCLALAQYLDKSKFEVYTMSNSKGNIDISNLESLFNVLHYNNKLKFTKIWKYIYALYKCDILYVPKQEKLSLVTFFNNIFFKKVIFLTIEGKWDDNYKKTLDSRKRNGFSKALKNVNNIKHIYSITKYLSKYNEEEVGIKSKEKTLYLGCDSKIFKEKKEKSKVLKNIVFIGNSMLTKGIHEYLNLAKEFSNINFHIVGKGGGIDFESIKKEYKNIIIHGSLNPKQLNSLLQDIDLHIFPSKSEGWGKVTFETAMIGIPTILYDTYGAEEWMINNKDGFIISNYEEIRNKIKELQGNENLLYETSLNAVKLANKFSWSNVIKDWEEEIIEMYRSNI